MGLTNRRFAASAHRAWDSITPLRAFDPDASEYEDEREVPVPWQNVCSCGAYKHEDNNHCDDCAAREGDTDHA